MIFKIIDNRTGKEPIYDGNHLFKEKWFKESDLIYCDLSSWSIDEERKYLVSRGLTGAEHVITKAIRDLIDTDPEKV